MSALSLPRPERIELICFAALGIVASLQWASLVSDPPATRVAIAVVVATAAGAALAAIGRLPRPRGARWALGAAVVAVALLVGLVVVGLPARLLLPAHWDELSANVNRSLNGLTDVPIPYAGADTWTRLVILLDGAADGRRGRLRGLLAATAQGRGADLRARPARRPLPGRGRLGPARPAAGGGRAPRAPGLRLALAAVDRERPGGRGLRRGHRRAGRGARSRAGRPGQGADRLPPLEPLQRPGAELQVGPVVRPTRLASEGDPPVRGGEREAALLEGDQPRHLRRGPLGPIERHHHRARPRPATQAPPEGDRTPARPRVGRPGQFRGAEPDQRLRHRRRDDARPPRRQRLTQRGWSLGDESGAAPG